MSVEMLSTTKGAIFYPESDGQPMAENTKQFRWIQVIVEGLRALFSDNPLVFVAGDLFWYPIEGAPRIRRAPDAMIVFGRPPGDRGSYLQWLEGGIPPQVVFEVLSPGNTPDEMDDKFEFYDLHGAEEYYLYDPDTNDLSGWQRRNGRMRAIMPVRGWTSPLLGITFDFGAGEMQIIRPDGERFLTFAELDKLMREQRAARQQAEQRAITAEERAARLAEKLRALGIDPDA